MPYPEFIAPLTPCNLSVRRCPVPREQASKRILIMRLGSYGDVLMGTPLLGALRSAYPEAHLTWIVEHTAREAIDANPYIDELVIWEGGFWKDLLSERWRKMLNKRRLLGLRWLFQAFRFSLRLRQGRYDVYISFQPEEWPSLTYATGAAHRIGVFDTFRQFYGDAATSAYTRLFTDVFRFKDLPLHRTDQYLLPLNALGVSGPFDRRMEMGFTEVDRAVVERLLISSEVNADPFVVLAPMTTWVSRNWSPERYAALGDALADCGRRVVLIGSAKPEERAVLSDIAARMRRTPVTVPGTLSFRQMTALLARSALVVSGDTGPMHVAAAVGTPYLALFGPTPVAGRAPLIGPGLSLMHPIPCGPCDKEQCPIVGDGYMRCLELITVEEVLKSALRLLEGDPAVARTG